MNPEKTLEALTNQFEAIKRVSKHGTEYWSARELQPLLGYETWRSFGEAIARAKIACERSSVNPKHHFADTDKMIEVGKGASRRVDDLFLSRYACYLIVQNGDSNKTEIALGQTYFAFQTHRQEAADEKAKEDALRLKARDRVTESFKTLSDAAKDAGVSNAHFGTFHDEGYKGLYGGLRRADIAEKKGIPTGKPLLDFMGHTELAMNDFRQTQAAERLKREQVQGQGNAIRVHGEVGRAVRQLVVEQGNTLPEDLPAEGDIKPLKAAAQKALKASERKEGDA
jgi:DNA-damage-inducible protein D